MKIAGCADTQQINIEGKIYTSFNDGYSLVHVD
jgi:hypothetical protein